MKATRFLLICLFGLFGCHDELVLISDGGGPAGDGMKCPALPDLAPVQPPCAAAAGLPGKNLFCVDFKDYPNIGALTGGWIFSDCSPSSPAGVRWTISQNRLQLDASNYSTFIGECTFTIPTIVANDFATNNTFTLSIVHTVNINDGSAFGTAAQLAQVYLGNVVSTRHVGSATYNRQSKWQWTQTLAKTNLPGSPSSYQPVLRLLAPVAAGGAFTGWHIDSIAINGSP